MTEDFVRGGDTEEVVNALALGEIEKMLQAGIRLPFSTATGEKSDMALPKSVADILVRHAQELKFIDLNSVLDDLRAEGIIRQHAYYDILRRDTRKKTMFLVEYLPASGDNAFRTFINVLRKRKYADLADRLEKGEDLITLSQEEDIRKTDSYVAKIDSIFSILFRKNPHSTYKKLLKVLESMERDDIVDRVEGGLAIDETRESSISLISSRYSFLTHERAMSDVADILARYTEDLSFIDLKIIFGDLMVQGIIKHHEYFEIVNDGTREKQQRLFLQEHLPQRGDNAFPTFITILRQRGYGSLASKLETGRDRSAKTFALVGLGERCDRPLASPVPTLNDFALTLFTENERGTTFDRIPATVDYPHVSKLVKWGFDLDFDPKTASATHENYKEKSKLREMHSSGIKFGNGMHKGAQVTERTMRPITRTFKREMSSGRRGVQERLGSDAKTSPKDFYRCSFWFPFGLGEKRTMAHVAEILIRHKGELNFINFETVLADLRVEGIINHFEYFDIVNKNTREKTLFLLECLPRSGDNAFSIFIEVLRRRNHAKFADILEQDVRDFLHQLSGEDLITLPEEEDIKKKDTYFEKIDSVFSILFKKKTDSTYEKLLKVLEAMERDDIIDRVEGGSVRSESPRSLTDIIQAKWDVLIDCLKVDEITSYLLKSGVLTQGDRDEIATPRREKERRITLLAKLPARIESRTFEKFLDALKAVGQDFMFKELRSQWEEIESPTPEEKSTLLNQTQDPGIFNGVRVCLMHNGIHADPSFLRTKTSPREDLTTEEERREGVLEGSGCSAGIPSDDDAWEMAKLLEESWDEWEDIGQQLKIDEKDLKRIREMKKDQPRTTYLLLQHWRVSSSNDRPSTFETLCKALLKQGMKPQADAITLYAIAKEKAGSPLLKEEPSDDDIWEIAGKLQEKSDEWEDLGRQLGVSEDQLRRIREMKKGPLRTLYLLLAQWKNSSSNEQPTTFASLHKALLKQGMKPEADEIINVICKKKSVEVKEGK
ncbi:unnamed protein product [Darwinula stevensoni]|uniref:Death domain-containing protein n=1 Tax=Darwinula stevensoni TaxID=69355 RepID=A0A7R8X875_9CRUS|nr:unnamed protein product [Darwinula stevensoni]CAG0889803.1 unnamed protein product [Darwinula stevensoni]